MIHDPVRREELRLFLDATVKIDLEVWRSHPHPRLFWLAVEQIRKLDVTQVSHEVVKASLIVLIVLDNAFRDIIRSHDATNQSISFLQVLPKDGDSVRSPIPPSETQRLKSFDWCICEKPGAVTRAENDEELSVDCQEFEDWLVSFSTRDWRTMGTLGLYTDVQKSFQEEINVLDDAAARKRLRTYLDATVNIHKELEVAPSHPHSQLFRLAVDHIRKLRVSQISHEVVKASFVVLAVLHKSSRDIEKSHDDANQSIFFLQGLPKDGDSVSSPIRQSTSELLEDAVWYIPDEPWKIRQRNQDCGEVVPYEFDRVIELPRLKLLISDRNDKHTVKVCARGQTVYDVFKTIHEKEALCRHGRDADVDLGGSDVDSEPAEWNVGSFFTGLRKAPGQDQWWVEREF